MNRQKILDLADYVEKSDSYCQVDWFHGKESKHPCGTPSCIAGHLFIMNGGKYYSAYDRRIADKFGVVRQKAVREYLEETLEVSPHQALCLTAAIPIDVTKSLEIINPTPEQAAWTLRNLAHTGKVVWRKDLPQEAPVIETTETTETKTENLNAPVLHK